MPSELVPRRKSRAVSFALLLFAGSFAAPSFAADGGAFDHARTLFLAASAGNGAATDDAVRRFQDLAAAAPPERLPLFLAYLGAAQTLQGRDAWMPWNKVHATESGLGSLDKALRLLKTSGVPLQEALETRLEAATTFLALPTMFNRFDAGKDLVKTALADPAFPTAPVEIRARIHLQAAVVAAHDGDCAQERRHLDAAAAMAPEIGVPKVDCEPKKEPRS